MEARNIGKTRYLTSEYRKQHHRHKTALSHFLLFLRNKAIEKWEVVLVKYKYQEVFYTVHWKLASEILQMALN